jgi:hypothetical protein
MAYQPDTEVRALIRTVTRFYLYSIRPKVFTNVEPDRFLKLVMKIPKELHYIIYNEVLFLPCAADCDNWRSHQHWRQSYYFEYSEETPPPSFAIQRLRKPFTFADPESYGNPDRSWDWDSLAMDV